jgi:hypothetical protein
MTGTTPLAIQTPMRSPTTMRMRMAGRAVTIPPVSPFWMSGHGILRERPARRAATIPPNMRGMWPEPSRKTMV